MAEISVPSSAPKLPPDIVRIFVTRILRMFAYGALSIILVVYLVKIGTPKFYAGLLLTLALAGDIGVSLWVTTRADRIGRRRMLVGSGALMLLAGVAFAATGVYWVLLLAAIIGIVSPTGNDVGPFLAIEQAALSAQTPADRRTGLLAWYHLAGSVATATGALVAGNLVEILHTRHISAVASYRVVPMLYAALAAGMIFVYLLLSKKVEAPARTENQPKVGRLGLHASRGIVLKMSALFTLDALGGGLIMQALIAEWFHLKFHVDPGVLGDIFFGANLLAGISALLAARIAKRIGLLNTMVFTHVPSNILLMLVPLMPNVDLAVLVLLLRFSISQMDVPTRQAYTMAVVHPDERSAANGITNVVRSVGAAVGPLFTGVFLTHPSLWSLPFLIGGGLKLIYDGLIFISFRRTAPVEGAPASAG